MEATGYDLTEIVVHEDMVHALLSLAEWWQVMGDAPIWPIPIQRLAGRARVAQQILDATA